MKSLRGLFAVVCLGWLAFSLLGEKHEVLRLDGGESLSVSGPAFAAGAVVDDFLLKDGELFSASSLSPQSASAKDCKT